jgi:hypothetical protein
MTELVFYIIFILYQVCHSSISKELSSATEIYKILYKKGLGCH